DVPGAGRRVPGSLEQDHHHPDPGVHGGLESPARGAVFHASPFRNQPAADPRHRSTAPCRDPDPRGDYRIQVVAIRGLVELCKLRIVGLVLVTAAAGFYLAAAPGIGLDVFLHLLVGTALVAAGTNALNQVAERDTDALMRRTARRPLPTGRLSVSAATIFAWTAGVLGTAYLAAFVNVTTAIIACVTLLSYVFGYTPLKRKTSLNNLVGRMPGP